MNTWKVEGDKLIESELPAAMLSHLFRTGYRVRTMAPSERTTHEVFVVLDPTERVCSVHVEFAEACAERDRLNTVAS